MASTTPVGEERAALAKDLLNDMWLVERRAVINVVVQQPGDTGAREAAPVLRVPQRHSHGI
eukprot:scaffold55350_cov58-Phaeocystis_antarctica.AAC.2